MADEVNEVVEEVEEIQPDKDGKYPETVPWKQYVGTKESLGKKISAAENKVSTLEEQLKGAIKQEDFEKVQKELEEAKTKLQTTEEQLKGVTEKSLTEKRDTLVKRAGLPEEDVKAMSEDALDAAIKVLNSKRPGADMGSGTGTGELKGSPQELTRQAYQ
ncbi:MAG: hypothetical protein ACWGQW_00285 [bacterium]